MEHSQSSRGQIGKMRIVFALIAAILPVSSVSADIIYESGTLGDTGVSRSDISNDSVPGTNVSDAVFVGVRFYVEQAVATTQIGGHFVKNIGAHESFFGGIVELDDENDFPDSGDLSTPDVVGSTYLGFPEPSGEVFGDLAEQLDPGWYALVFGSGLFGATGSGVAVRNGIDVGHPSYIAYVSAHWRNLDGTSIPFDNHRFVLRGTIVPEATSAFLFFLGSLPLAWKRLLR